MSPRILLLLSCLALVAISCTPSAPAQKPVAEARSLEVPGAIDKYRAWVLDQTDQLVVQTEAFAAAVTARDRTKAQGLYAPTRMFYERIEPIAEALGDLDPRIDAREGDIPADQWGGFHKLEALLWSTGDLAPGAALAKTLVDDVHLLRAKVETASITVEGLVTGAVELLNEVSKSKVTGEEERYSHTDLWDFQANVDGSAQIWNLLKPGVTPADPTLSQTIDQRLAALQSLLETHKRGTGFVLYGELKPDEVKALSAAVDGLAEPLSQLGALAGSPKP